jgi:hypothetical protein
MLPDLQTPEVPFHPKHPKTSPVPPSQKVSQHISTSSDYSAQEEEVKPEVDDKPTVTRGEERTGNDEESGIQCLGWEKSGTEERPYIVYE